MAFKETVNVPLVIVDPKHEGGAVTEAVGSHLDLVPTTLAYAGLSETEMRQRYPFLKGHNLSGSASDPKSVGPRGNSENPGKGSLYTYDMIMTIDAQWMASNAPKILDVAAAEAGLEFNRGTEAFKSILDEIGLPDENRREIFRGVFDGRYKLIRYFGLAHYNLPQSVEELLAENDVALYDMQRDPDETSNLANPDNPNYDESLLAEMNAKLNTLIEEEIGEDKALIELPSLMRWRILPALKHAKDSKLEV